MTRTAFLVALRQRKQEEIEKQLEVLTKYKNCIPKEEYEEIVATLLHSLPDPGTYDAYTKADVLIGVKDENEDVLADGGNAVDVDVDEGETGRDGAVEDVDADEGEADGGDVADDDMKVGEVEGDGEVKEGEENADADEGQAGGGDAAEGTNGGKLVGFSVQDRIVRLYSF
jgi:hypothetical protein